MPAGRVRIGACRTASSGKRKTSKKCDVTRVSGAIRFLDGAGRDHITSHRNGPRFVTLPSPPFWTLPFFPSAAPHGIFSRVGGVALHTSSNCIGRFSSRRSSDLLVSNRNAADDAGASQSGVLVYVGTSVRYHDSKSKVCNNIRTASVSPRLSLIGIRGARGRVVVSWWMGAGVGPYSNR
jgi:hypothetical protein